MFPDWKTGARKVRVFEDRTEAGQVLAGRLSHLRDPNTVVLGIPRGGVPVAYEVARKLGAPLDVIIVRKLGLPYQPELAMGAIGERGVKVVDRRIMSEAGVGESEFNRIEQRERTELERRAELFRRGRAPIALTGRTAVIVDDGIATGSTVRAAVRVARQLGAVRVVVATPVASPNVVGRMSDDADEVVVVEAPDQFYAIGQFYRDFSPTPDSEVTRLLDLAASHRATSATFEEDIRVLAGGHRLEGHLTLPADWKGIVVFAHGSGSSRHSPRNWSVARALNRSGFGTLLFDLLTADEEADRRNVFDVEMLGDRLVDVTEWLFATVDGSEGRVGFFGASTGAAAALGAAARLGNRVGAVVSRGGRPDLAGPELGKVTAPTLLIVGGADPVVADLNADALRQLRCVAKLEIVPGATHLFEEPGTLNRVAELAAEWFGAHLSA
jgi:putative phosphoribosyl transferase